MVAILRMLPASSEQRLGMLINILQGTGQTPTTKHCPAPNSNSAKAEKCWYIQNSRAMRTKELFGLAGGEKTL